jgi:hypothetical protein
MKLAPVLAAALLMAACSPAPDRDPKPEPVKKRASQRPSPYTTEFWQAWSDGKVEICEYDSTSAEGSGKITLATSLEGKPPVMTMRVSRRTGDRAEMLSVSIALEPVDERPAGSCTRVSWSWQAPIAHGWRQIVFGRTRGVAQTLGDRRTEGQQLFDYPPQSLAEDVLLLWARRIAWPQIRIGSRVPVYLIPSVTRGGRFEEERATVSLTPEGVAEVKPEDGTSYTFRIERVMPHRVREWQTGRGERAVLSGSRRVGMPE